MAALEWLNRKTTDDVGFFGVEISAIRIGESVPAPQFNVVVRPNEWARERRDQAIASDNTPERLANHAYWAAFDPLAQEAGVQHGMQKPAKGRNYYHYFTALSKKVGVCAYIARAENRVGAYVFLYERGPEFYSRLTERRGDIEQEFGGALRWTSQGEGCWFNARLEDANADDEADWPRQHRWLASTMARLKAAFEPRLRAMGALDPLPLESASG